MTKLTIKNNVLNLQALPTNNEGPNIATLSPLSAFTCIHPPTFSSLSVAVC